MLKIAKRKKLSILSLVLALTLIGIVYANILWNKSLTNNGITITVSYNAELYNDNSFTQVCTSVTWTPSTLDGADLTTKPLSQFIWFKYTGSATGSKNFIVLETNNPTGFTFEWSENSTGTFVWHTIGDGAYLTMSFTVGTNFCTQLRMSQTATHSAGVQGLTQTFNYEITD